VTCRSFAAAATWRVDAGRCHRAIDVLVLDGAAATPTPGRSARRASCATVWSHVMSSISL
jgi:hypothetical protein